MKTLEKVAEIRRSIHLKPPIPEDAFVARMRRARALCDFVEESQLPSGVKCEARRLYLVVLCAAFEIFWRDFLKLCIDEFRPNEQQLSHLTKQSFTIAEMAEIASKRVSFGELISYGYRFQSTDAVNRAFSEVFSFDAFGSLSRATFGFFELMTRKRKPVSKMARSGMHGSAILKLCPKIDSCFKIRHETVHNLGTIHHVSRRQVQEFEGAISTFNRVAGMHFGWTILLDYGALNAIVADRGQIGENIRRVHDLLPKLGIPDGDDPRVKYITQEMQAEVREEALKSAAKGKKKKTPTKRPSVSLASSVPLRTQRSSSRFSG